jgi:hypothetical protein
MLDEATSDKESTDAQTRTGDRTAGDGSTGGDSGGMGATGDGVRKGRKIAIVGTAPGYEDAPFHDESWEIWGLSRMFERAPRITRWFELHDFADVCKTWNPGDTAQESRAREVYLDWLRNFEGQTFVQAQYAGQCKNGRAYPKDEILQMFQRRYFTNTVSWLMALAIMEQEITGVHTTVALYGIDMELSTNGNDEYGQQRPSCEYFCGMIDALPGMDLYVPQRSSLLKARELYAFEFNPLFYKAKEKKLMVATMKAKAEAQAQHARELIAGTTGALEILDWTLHNWE